MARLEYAVFGDREGSHQLLETSLRQEEPVLQDLRFLVDRPGGHIGSEVNWSPYWGCGPVLDWWALWRGEEDNTAARRNMVRCRVALIRQDDVFSVSDILDILMSLDTQLNIDRNVNGARLVYGLSQEIRPIVVSGISLTPSILASLWPLVWPRLRGRLSVRTLFGSETLEQGAAPDIAVVPDELRARWLTYSPIDIRASDARLSPVFDELMHRNWTELPANVTALQRLRRIADGIDLLMAGRAQYSDALLVAKTVEGFGDAFSLPDAWVALVAERLSYSRTAEVTDIRSASLTTLDIMSGRLGAMERAVAKWIAAELPDQPDHHALWILEHQASDGHADWWVQAVSGGLRTACNSMNDAWADALWRWWLIDVRSFSWIERALAGSKVAEERLVTCLPSDVPSALFDKLTIFCGLSHWDSLLAGVLRMKLPLQQAVSQLRGVVRDPAKALKVLLQGYKPEDVVHAAADDGWPPLLAAACEQTVRDSTLLGGVLVNALHFPDLLYAHLQGGGQLPATARSTAFVSRVFDGCIEGSSVYLSIMRRLDRDALSAGLDYARPSALWSALGPADKQTLATTMAEAWLEQFASNGRKVRPDPVVARAVRAKARTALRTMELVIDYLEVFPEVTEDNAVDLLKSQESSWDGRGKDRLCDLLCARHWPIAGRQFTHSSNLNLRAVGDRTLDRLGYGRPWAPWLHMDERAVRSKKSKRGDDMLRVLFMAANPVKTERLAIDAEIREITNRIQAAKLRDQISLQSAWAVRPDDLQHVLLQEDPNVVHFSGHGSGKDGLVFDSESGGTLVSSEALSDLFRVLKKNIRVVVLNACYSEEQAAGIVEAIDFVIGMTDSIDDESASLFAGAFYQGLAYGKTVRTAFELAVNQLRLMNRFSDAELPVLKLRKGASPDIQLVTPQ